MALNSLHLSLTFTFEKRTDNALPFLDVVMEKAVSWWFTSVCRKPTPPGQYARCDSFAPKTEDKLYWNCSAQGSVYLLQIQNATMPGQHQSYSSQKWQPRQCYLGNHIQGHRQGRSQKDQIYLKLPRLHHIESNQNHVSNCYGATKL